MEQEAEEFAVEEDKKKLAEKEDPKQDYVESEHAEFELQENVDVEVELQAAEVVQQNEEQPRDSVKDLLTRLNLEKLVNIFEEEEITMQTLRTSTATELKGILKISFGSAKLNTEEVARVNAAAAATFAGVDALEHEKEKQKKK